MSMTHVVNCTTCSRSHEFASRRQMRADDTWAVTGEGVRWHAYQRHYAGACWLHQDDTDSDGDSDDTDDEGDDDDTTNNTNMNTRDDDGRRRPLDPTTRSPWGNR